MRISQFTIVCMLISPIYVGAQTCESDSDCAENYHCDQPISATICLVDEENNETCETPTPEPGECVPGPIACESDDECPGISECVFGPDTTPAPPCSSEDEECPERLQTEPEQAYCEYVPAECDENTPCAPGLECNFFDTPCAEPAPAPAQDCAEDEECPVPEPADPSCETSTMGACYPALTECETNDDCVDGWSCTETVEYECSTSGSGASGGASSDASEPMEVDATDEASSSDEDQMDSSGAGGASGSDASGNSSGSADSMAPEDGDSAASEDADADEPMTEDGEVEGVEDESSDCVPQIRQICQPAGYEHYSNGPIGRTDTYDEADSSGPGTATDSDEPGDIEEPNNDDGAPAGETGGDADAEDDEAENDTTDDSDDASDDTSGTNEDSASGCDCTTMPNAPLPVWFGFLGLPLLIRRRR